MAGGKFIGWALDMVPDVVKWFKKGARVNEIDKIEKDAAVMDDAADNKRLSNIVKKYDKDVKSNS